MSFSEFEYQQAKARLEAGIRKKHPELSPHEPCDDESELHERILDWCRYRGWLSIHSRMDRPTTQAKGVCDFVIVTDDGRVLFVEAKAAKKKLTTEQLGFAAHLRKLGHKLSVVHSLADFMDVVSNK